MGSKMANMVGAYKGLTFFAFGLASWHWCVASHTRYKKYHALYMSAQRSKLSDP